MAEAKDLELAGRAVVRVGEGRGFVIETNQARYVITAAHCLPRFPRTSPTAQLSATFGELLGTLGNAASVWAECLFVDPVADIAVLGSPDPQMLWNEADAYEKLVERQKPLSVGDMPDEIEIMVFDLEGRWITGRATAEPPLGSIWLSDVVGGIKGGMSGSPIILGNGTAVGVVSTSHGIVGDPKLHTRGGPEPRLKRNLPGPLLAELATDLWCGIAIEQEQSLGWPRT
jgi:hypothetical protein